MNVDFFIHGVPVGQDYWGLKEEEAYIQSYYGFGRNEETLFVADIRQNNGKNYFYCSYLKNKDVLSFDGRPGSYFGLTARFDMIYADIGMLFKLFEISFTRFIEGLLLRSEAGKIKYLVRDFKNATLEIETLEESVLKLMGTTLLSSSFLVIDQSYLSSGEVLKLNTGDCPTNGALLLKRYGQIHLSDSFPTKREVAISEEKTALQNSFKAQLQTAIAAKRKELDGVINDNENLKNKVSALQSTIEDYKKTLNEERNNIRRLKEEIEKKDKEIEKISSSRSLEESLGSIKEPILKIALYLEQNYPKGKIFSKYSSYKNKKHFEESPDERRDSKPKVGKKLSGCRNNNFWPILIILIFLLVGGGVFYLFKSCSSNSNFASEKTSNDIRHSSQDDHSPTIFIHKLNREEDMECEQEYTKGINNVSEKGLSYDQDSTNTIISPLEAETTTISFHVSDSLGADSLVYRKNYIKE